MKWNVGRQRKNTGTPTCKFSESRLRLLISNLVSCINSPSISLIWRQWKSKHEAKVRDVLQSWNPDGNTGDGLLSWTPTKLTLVMVVWLITRVKKKWWNDEKQKDEPTVQKVSSLHQQCPELFTHIKCGTKPDLSVVVAGQRCEVGWLFRGSSSLKNESLSRSDLTFFGFYRNGIQIWSATRSQDMLIYRMMVGSKRNWCNMFNATCGGTCLSYVSYYWPIRLPCIRNFFPLKSWHITGISLDQSLVTPFLF